MRYFAEFPTRLLFAILILVALPVALEAGKKKEKVDSVKIIKASETHYKGAKIIRPSDSQKKKGFLWFRKKEPETLVLKKAPVATQPVEARVISSERSPDSDKLVSTDVPQVPRSEKKKLVDAKLVEEGNVMITPSVSLKAKDAVDKSAAVISETEVEAEAP